MGGARGSRYLVCIHVQLYPRSLLLFLCSSLLEGSLAGGGIGGDGGTRGGAVVILSILVETSRVRCVASSVGASYGMGDSFLETTDDG